MIRKSSIEIFEPKNFFQKIASERNFLRRFLSFTCTNFSPNVCCGQRKNNLKNYKNVFFNVAKVVGDFGGVWASTLQLDFDIFS